MKNLKRIFTLKNMAFYREHEYSGSVLVVTLLIITILISMTVTFAHDVYISTALLSNWSNAQKASLIARSGQIIGASYIRAMDTQKYTDRTDINLTDVKEFGEEGLLIVNIQDENSKFNINNIIYQNGLTNTDALSSLKKLFEYLNIDSILADAIADYIDPDSEPRLFNSEKNVKNSYLWSIEELQLVQGMTKNTFETIKPYITVLMADTKININTAPMPVLISLHPDISESLAQRIIDYREITPFEDPAYIQRVPGMESIGPLLIGKTITVKSSYFRVTSIATVSEITRTVESVLDISSKINFWREG
jgi:general secretion pathway protein K